MKLSKSQRRAVNTVIEIYEKYLSLDMGVSEELDSSYKEFKKMKDNNSIRTGGNGRLNSEQEAAIDIAMTNLETVLTSTQNISDSKIREIKLAMLELDIIRRTGGSDLE